MDTPSNRQPPGKASFKEALKFWTQLGFINFGGPAGQIAIMHQEVVERRRWVNCSFSTAFPGCSARVLSTSRPANALSKKRPTICRKAFPRRLPM